MDGTHGIAGDSTWTGARGTDTRIRRVHQFVRGLAALLVIAPVFVFTNTPIFRDSIPHRTVISVSTFAGGADRAMRFWDQPGPPDPNPSPPTPCGPGGCWPG